MRLACLFALFALTAFAACTDDAAVDTSVCTAAPAADAGCPEGTHAQGNDLQQGLCQDQVEDVNCGAAAQSYWACKVQHPTCADDTTNTARTSTDCGTEHTNLSVCVSSATE